MRCDVCGKFRREEDLRHQFMPDSHYGPEDSYWECLTCIYAGENKRLAPKVAEMEETLANIEKWYIERMLGKKDGQTQE